ncbi:molybdenum cofactor biosynthesis protein E [Mycobacterium tuberculosis]|nr:molybdenum cofactor biosynthesis protein E [Mycobacterium tuberculosis]
MTQVLRAALTDQPIFLAEHEELVSHRSAGAIVGFVGMIRDRDGGRGVLRLEYSAPRRPHRSLRIWWRR